MRQGQNRRTRGRNNTSTSNRKGPNPLQRGYESNGPDVKVRGNAQHIAEKYQQLARDSQSSGDRVMAENYLQHAEHYFRLVLAAQEQLTLQYGTTFTPQRFGEDGEEGDDEGEEEGQQSYPFGVAQPNQSGEGGESGFAQQGYDNQPRQDRGGQDRNVQDRGGQDRNLQDRNPQERGGQERFDRNNNQRFDRNNNRDRNNNNRDRQDRDRNDRNLDRAPRAYERGESQPDDQPRQDRNGSERFDRNAAPRHQDLRQDTRNDNRNVQPREPEVDVQDVSEQPRVERAPRQPRERYDRDRAPRVERSRPVEDDIATAEALPAFLTKPVRVPVAEEAAPEPRKPAPVEAAAPAAEGTEVAAKKPRGRPRRSPREVMDALATEPSGE
jgi:Domain of unknown function (DUF4167)